MVRTWSGYYPSARALILAAACLCLPGPASVARASEGVPQTFTRTALQPSGAPALEVIDDFDGDGRLDILLCDNRTLSLFLSGKKGPDTKPTHVIRASADAVLLDVADLDRNGAREVMLLKSDGLYKVRPENGEDGKKGAFSEELVLAAASRLIPRNVENLTFIDFIRDITGDGPEDVIVPDLTAMRVFSGDEKGALAHWTDIPYEPRSEYHQEPLSETGGRREMLTVPLLMAGGMPGDRRLVLYDGNWLHILARSEDGTCRRLSSRNVYKTDSRVAADRDIRARFLTSVHFEDLNADGRGDLVLCDNATGELRFFSGIEEEQPDDHDFVIKVSGSTFQPVFTDLDSDGLIDMILPLVGEIGAFTIMRVVFSSSFDLNYLVFFNRKNPIFRIAPDDMRTIAFPLSIFTTPDGISVEGTLILSFEGDFNGDGRNDLLLRGGGRKLHVFYGLEDGTFSEKPDIQIDARFIKDAYKVKTRTEDFNGDGRADVYIHQKSGKAECWDVYVSR